jgi:hypothetical protein
MTKYFIHLFTSVILCTTTWIAVFPVASEKGGFFFGVIACAFTTMIEFIGYLCYRAYERNRKNLAYLFCAMVILAASGTLTFWGAGLMKIWMTGSKQDAIAEEIAKKNDQARDEYNYQMRMYEDAKAGFEARKEKRIAELEEEKIYKIKNSTTSKYFADRYLEGNASSYRRNLTPANKRRLEIADGLTEEYEQKIADVRTETFSVAPPCIPRTIHRTSRIEIATYRNSGNDLYKCVEGV